MKTRVWWNADHGDWDVLVWSKRESLWEYIRSFRWRWTARLYGVYLRFVLGRSR